MRAYLNHTGASPAGGGKQGEKPDIDLTPAAQVVNPFPLELLQNVPNPFNPSTTIRYVLPSRVKVRVTIYDVSGRPVVTLVDREEAAGPYGVEWNGTGADGARVSSGVYFVRIEAGKQ